MRVGVEGIIGENIIMFYHIILLLFPSWVGVARIIGENII
jgi:hypothetical protein